MKSLKSLSSIIKYKCISYSFETNMTDDGAIFRAIKMGCPDNIIADTLGILSGTLEQYKEEFEEIKGCYSQAKPFEQTAALLMKPAELVWYVYHVIETDKKALEKEILAETNGEQRVGPPKLTPPPLPPQEETEKPEPRTPKRRKKDVTKENVEEIIRETAEQPAAEVLVDDAGRLGREIATGRQELGKHVMEATSTAMVQFGYEDPIAFFDAIFKFFIDNYGTVQNKDAQIADLTAANETFQATIDEDIVKLFIGKSIDRFATSAQLGKIPITFDDIEAYRDLLIAFFKSSLLGKVELGPEETARYRKLIDDIVTVSSLKEGGK